MADNNNHPKEEPLRLEPTLSVAEHDEKPVPKYDKTDYSGAHEKTDPKEIALVKKLDRWIMVCSPVFPSCNINPMFDILTWYVSSPCFGACTGSTTSTETPSPWPDSTISRTISTSRVPVCICAIESCFTVSVLTLCRISDLCFYPIRRLHPGPGPFQHVPHSNSSLPLHGMQSFFAPPISSKIWSNALNV